MDGINSPALGSPEWESRAVLISEQEFYNAKL